MTGPGRPLLLVLRALGLGDFLTALPALRGIAEAFPYHHRLLAAPLALEPLALLTGVVEGVLDLARLEPLAAPQAPDVAVNLHGRGPHSHRVLLRTRPRGLIAFAHPGVFRSERAPRWRSDEHEVQRWCRLLAAHGLRADPGRLELGPLSVPVVPAAVGATLLHPGAASQSRRWPVDRWAALARAEAAAGRRVLVTAGPGEVDLAQSVAHRAGLDAGVVQCGGDLLHLAALVGAAGRVVVGDTGVAHLATALGTPSVVLFGPASPALWGPPPDRGQHRVLWAGLTGDPHGATVAPGLLAISVRQVQQALAELDRAGAGVAA